MEIPIINYHDPQAGQQLSQSLRQTGFAVLNNHPISPALLNKIYQDWGDFFASDVKQDYEFDRQMQDGFVSIDNAEVAKGYEKKDIKEYYHVYPWGRYPKTMGPEALQLFSDMSSLAGTLLGWIEDNTPSDIRANFSMPLHQMITDSNITLLRILHYPPLKDNEIPEAERAAPHHDINLLTLLPSATQSGLQLQDTHGNWHDIPCDEGMITINTGDMLEFLTQKHYPSSPHRVLNPTTPESNISRLSMPFFLCPRPEVLLSEGFTAQDYLEERLRENGVLGEDVSVR